jgi:hypothetical protein
MRRWGAASPEVVAASGLSVTQVGDAMLMAVNRIDVLALNRLLGLGLRSSPSDAALANAVNALEQTGAPRCFVPVAPTGASEDHEHRKERTREETRAADYVQQILKRRLQAKPENRTQDAHLEREPEDLLEVHAEPRYEC